MKNLIYLIVIFVTISCNNSHTDSKNNSELSGTTQPNQNSIKKDSISIALPSQEKTEVIDSSLKECYITFGVPSSESDKEWNGDNILFAEIVIYNSDNTFYKASQEHRNAPIGAGHAVYLIMPFKPEDKRKIKFNKISKIEVNLTGRHGNAGGYNPHNDHCVYRTEAVLNFNNNDTIATGYNEPSRSIMVGLPGSNISKLSVNKANFHNKATLVEPIN